MPDDHVSVVLLMIIVLPAFVPPAKANNGGPFLRKNVCEGTARPFCGIAMFVVQITTKLRDEDWFARCDFEQTRVCLTHLKGEIFRATFHSRCSRTISTQRHPIAIFFARKIRSEERRVGKVERNSKLR